MPPSWAGWWKKEAANSPYPSPRFASPGFSTAAAGRGRTHRIHLCHHLLFQRKESILKPPEIRMHHHSLASSAALGWISLPPLLLPPFPSQLLHLLFPRNTQSPPTTAPIHGGLEGPSPQVNAVTEGCSWWDTVPTMSNLHLNPGKTTCRKRKVRQLEGHRLGHCSKAELDTEPGSEHTEGKAPLSPPGLQVQICAAGLGYQTCGTPNDPPCFPKNSMF